ncbi:single-stranded DNA-binding protein [Novosphingobium sp. ZW T3_23]|uniref:single-stranded DNA-binding protein n=1 Tax=Novosphingobium sp. ZW T3_23 TaxID=3378084 RepID=UPI003852352C
MASVNKVILLGNMCADAEVKSFQNGGRIANLRIATNESWRDKQSGERKERVEYHSVVVSGDGLIGVIEQYTRKGSKLYLEGQLRTRKWTDQSGNDRYSTEIAVGGIGGKVVLLDSQRGEDGQGGGRQQRGNGQREGNDRGGQRTGGDWGREHGGREVYNSNTGWNDGGFDDDLGSDSIPF